MRQATKERSDRWARRDRGPWLPEFTFGFLDETGTVHSPSDPFFAVGLMQCKEPYELLRPMQRIRDQKQFYDEIKWNKVSAKKLPILKLLLDVFLKSDHAMFSAFICDKRAHDPIARFGGQFEAYEAIARQLVLGSARRGEMMWIIADEYSTPPKVTFEENVRDWVNGRCKVPAVSGVCRMRSGGVDLLQMIDLVLGAIVFEYKLDAGIGSYRPKIELLEHLKQETGISSFLGGYRDDRFNVAEYEGP